MSGLLGECARFYIQLECSRFLRLTYSGYDLFHNLTDFGHNKFLQISLSNTSLRIYNSMHMICIYLYNCQINILVIIYYINSPLFCKSSRLSCPAVSAAAAAGFGGKPKCGVGVPPGYQAQPGACPLNMRNLSYTDSLCADACCSFCDARFRNTLFIDET